MKIVIAAVVLIGGGAAAYFATDGFGSGSSGKAKEADTSTEKKDEGTNKETPSMPVIPPKKDDAAAKDENPAQ